MNIYHVWWHKANSGSHKKNGIAVVKANSEMEAIESFKKNVEYFEEQRKRYHIPLLLVDIDSIEVQEVREDFEFVAFF